MSLLFKLFLDLFIFESISELNKKTLWDVMINNHVVLVFQKELVIPRLKYVLYVVLLFKMVIDLGLFLLLKIFLIIQSLIIFLNDLLVVISYDVLSVIDLSGTVLIIRILLLFSFVSFLRFCSFYSIRSRSSSINPSSISLCLLLLFFYPEALFLRSR